MDVIYDIDGTLADASHRMHHIVNPEGKKDWGAFLSATAIAQDAPIPATWLTLAALARSGARVAFVTGRNEGVRKVTYDWLRGAGLGQPCAVRRHAQYLWRRTDDRPPLLMRSSGDRRPSAEVKRDLLGQLRSMGWKPMIAFEDRADDARMWRSEGLVCAQVAEGNY